MNRTNRWLLLSCALIISGLIICYISYFLLGFDIRKFNNISYVTNTYEITESFSSIDIDTDSDDLSFVLSPDNSCKVICYENEAEPHKINVKDDTLVIRESAELINKWHFSFNSEKMNIVIYLPKAEYDRLSINSDTGDIETDKYFQFENIDITTDTGDVKLLSSARNDITIKSDTGTFSISDISGEDMELKSDTGRIELNRIALSGDLNIKANTGKVILDNVKCKDFTSDGDTGSLILNYVVASGNIDFRRDTGSIELNDSDAQNIKVRTDTGKVDGTLLSGKVFEVKSDTGRINVPASSDGGKCEIRTDTGNITIRIK